ncbi:MAG TPA: RteC domain-containing protein, partial [Mucilaginibacter sp.]
QYIDLLKKEIKENDFEDEKAEIQFFKFTKPKFLSRYVYYIELIKFHQYLPDEEFGAIEDYVEIKKKEISRFFESNQVFHIYYKCKYEFYDRKYFLRSEYDVRLNPDITQIESDPQFRTNYDFLCARVLASYRMLGYIQEFITKMLSDKEAELSKALEFKKIVWTDTAAALDELAYALTYCGAINNGKASVIDIRKGLGILFSCAPGDLYDSAYNMRQRKIKPAKFIDKLKEAFTKWFDEKP